MESSSFLGSSKRAKAPGNIAQVAHCLVDGCNADLSLCRDYHRRHKVCEAHSKTPMVTIGGREQRFCQQCSRFHSLVEFDEGKRSCRKRLDGHNRRRRKPQPDSLTRNSGLVFSAHQNVSGTTLLSFANPHVVPSTVVGSSWAGLVKAENEISLYNNQQQLNYIDGSNPFPECSAQSYKGGANQFQFMQGNGGSCTSICHTNAVSGISSDRALSLLSSAPPSITREFGLNHGIQTPDAPIPPPAQPLVDNLHYSDVGQFPPVQVSPSDSHGGDMPTLHFSEMFHHDGPPSPSSGSHQTLTFRWE